MERACARFSGGAKSPTKGNIIWGVTVVIDAMKDSAAKASKLVVRQRPSHYIP